ncbi:hypothetical protein XM75_u0187 [Vibrio vulnificus]|nr:hypothetical protein XM75_u0187 [Vibrio vulnificus]
MATMLNQQTLLVALRLSLWMAATVLRSKAVRSQKVPEIRAAIKNDIYGQLDDITKQVKKLMDTLEQESRKRGYTVVADAYKRCVEQLDDFFKKADGPISKVLSDFDDRLKMILPEAPLVTSGTSFSISAGTAQGGSKAEVIKTRNKTKKKTDTCPLCNKKIGKSSLIIKFNESSKNIFDNIADFI